MLTKKFKLITGVAVIAALALPLGVAAQDTATQNHKPKHHHYIFKDSGTFGGPGSTPTEFQQVLNNRGTVVGGADTPALNPYPNCFNPFNQSFECYVQHAFAWTDEKLTDLGTLPNGSSSFAFFITDNGLIVGGSENGAIDPAAGTPEYFAVLWEHGKIMDLGTLGGTSSLAVQANNRRQVIGFAQNAIPDSFSLVGLGTQTRAFIWENGVMRDLLALGGPDSFPQYINDRGQVAGVSYISDIADSNTGVPQIDPFLWENGKMKDLGNFGGANSGPFINGLNNYGEVTGTMLLADNITQRGFLWDGEKLMDLGSLAGSFTAANGLNDAGEVIGSSGLDGGNTFHAFLWKNGVMTDLGTVDGDPCSDARSINSSGQVAGESQASDGNGGCVFQFTHAVLWENGGPGVDLNTLIPPGSSMQLTGAFWINDRGEITGRGLPPDCDNIDACGRAFLLIPCDEDHPGIEGCNYDLVEASTVADFRPTQATQAPPTTAQAPDCPFPK